MLVGWFHRNSSVFCYTHMNTRMQTHMHKRTHTHTHIIIIPTTIIRTGKTPTTFPAAVTALGSKCSHLCTAVKVALAAGGIVLASLQVGPSHAHTSRGLSVLT